MAGRMLPKVKRAAKGFSPAAGQSKQFIKHVLPATVKPIHALWHEVIAFIFLMLAGLVGYKTWQRQDKMHPLEVASMLVFIAVMAGYGISSYIKSRRISRS